MDFNLKGKRSLLAAVLFFAVVTAFFYAVIAGTMPKYKAVSGSEQLSQTDLSRECVSLGLSSGEYYTGRLYTSEDFENGAVAQGNPDAKYGTFRVVVPLEAGKVYGITGQTATYAQRVYVNGELLSEVGRVSENAADFVPKTDNYTVYFRPDSDTAEIIVQNAWFNHVSGALQKISLGEQNVISASERARTMCDGFTVGVMLAMAIFFFGMFLFYSKQRGLLWFSLSSFCAAVHYLIYESKQIAVLFPKLDWYVGHKIEYITNFSYFVFIAMFACAILRLRFPKPLRIFSFALYGAVSLYYIVSPSTFYTRYIVPVSGAVIAYCLFISVFITAVSLKKHLLCRIDRVIACATVLITAAVYIVEALTYFSRVFYIRSYAVILFAFCNAIVLTVNISQAEKELDEAMLREKEIKERGETLERMNILKSEFMHNIAHEMKTPLAVMSGYAQLTEREIRKNMINDETVSNLSTISSEAMRLSDLVTKLLNVSYSGVQTASVELNRICPSELLADAASVCRPVLAKRNNVLKVECSECPDIIANREALLQVIINLAVNSGKHTENGTVTFSAAPDADDPSFVGFGVRDTGEGISPEILPHVFEKGRSSDGGSGLGLAICREIIESTGGSIIIKETGKSGTQVYFTVPSGRDEA